VPGLLAVLLLMPAGATAGDILEARVTQADGRYDLAIRARIDAPSDTVYRAITDYSNLAAINPDIEVSELLETTAAGVSTVRTVIHVCILVFCKQVEQLQHVTYPDADTIEAVIVPEGSDFRSGFARWQLSSPTAATTVLQFVETFEPDFWVPPLIGSWLIQRKLVREVTETTAYIEARQRTGRP
jgi:Polyketide cyclase / dehydrase and lipid transport